VLTTAQICDNFPFVLSGLAVFVLVQWGGGGFFWLDFPPFLRISSQAFLHDNYVLSFSFHFRDARKRGIHIGDSSRDLNAPRDKSYSFITYGRPLSFDMNFLDSFHQLGFEGLVLRALLCVYTTPAESSSWMIRWCFFNQASSYNHDS